MFKNHLWVSTYDICLSGPGLPHSKWCFIDPPIVLQNSRYHYFFYCVILHCVNVPHFTYPFFGLGAFRLFPGSGYDKQCCYEHSWAHVLVVWLIILWVYTKSGIAGSWGKLFPNFLRNCHTNIQRNLHSLQNAGIFPLSHNLSNIGCYQCFWSWPFL